jgi:hypothetical protein
MFTTSQEAKPCETEICVEYFKDYDFATHKHKKYCHSEQMLKDQSHKHLQQTTDENCHFDESSEKSWNFHGRIMEKSWNFAVNFIEIFSSLLCFFIVIAWLIIWKLCNKTKAVTRQKVLHYIIKVSPPIIQLSATPIPSHSD